MARNTLGTSAVTNLSEGFVDDGAVLDTAHVGDIRGALGTIHRGDVSRRPGLSAKLKTLLAIVGPGLIVMVGDNDAGAFGTYTQAGQNSGLTSCGHCASGAGPVRNREWCYASAQFREWGTPAYPRALRQVLGRLQRHRPVYLERAHDGYRIHGVTFAVGYLGLPKLPSVDLAGAVVIGAASTGSFRRFERAA